MLLRQLESVDKEVEFVQKQIAGVAREDEDVKKLMTIPVYSLEYDKFLNYSIQENYI